MPTFASFDGLTLNYTIWEGTAEAPPVVLQHGFAADTNANWMGPGVVKALRTAGLTVISLDARGHGRSAKPHDAASYGEDTMARDVQALFDELGLDEVSLVGYSMGAVIALVVAGRDPRVRRLAIGGVGSGVIDCGGVDTRVVTREAISTALLADDPAQAPAEGAAFRALADGLGADRKALAAVASAIQTQVVDLDAVTVPALVLAGDADPLAAEPHRLAAALSDARLQLVPGDHLTAVMAPEFSRTLAAFVTENRI
ncbi:Lysophospholipase, alpha-beta hydrolase superfamily [Amycolatopsis marina]|uniref:Lysophospholipase, alpha-beta hydrolase superfamily n=1 Tax=Amycolatopsis marina TaxID=490629 RepID=A0A1I0X848_9PSEU|nr:alpha/beta fold hydrolase [Amycolatopsis marina]SFA97202.1 Lysophospholipase, alpha-beta hydrolase superfamily [Amycolatopsis marina]